MIFIHYVRLIIVLSHVTNSKIFFHVRYDCSYAGSTVPIEY
jgi:hypothetical protein